MCQIQWASFIRPLAGITEGAFFNSEGEFIHKDPILTDVRLEDSVLSVEGEDKRLFLGRIKKMLPW